MYADDSKVISEGNVMSQSELQADINEIDNWCKKWSMSLNSKKFKIMHYGKKNPRNKYYIQHGEEKVWLQESEVEKDLGIMVSSDGKYGKQVEAAVSKANSALGRMRKTFKFFKYRVV